MSTRIADWNGLPAVYIENDLAEAVVTLHGCHVVSFAPRGSREVLWVSGKSYFADGKPIRGGIPVCWPWFGGAGQPAHGLARLSQWIQTGVTEKENGETVFLYFADRWGGGDDELVQKYENPYFLSSYIVLPIRFDEYDRAYIQWCDACEI